MFREQEQSAEQARLGPREAGRRGGSVTRDAAGTLLGPLMKAGQANDRSGPELRGTAAPVKLDAPTGKRRAVEAPPESEADRAAQDRRREHEPRRGFLRRHKFASVIGLILLAAVAAAGSALINAARNTGGSIGVSLAANVLAHREQFHQSRLAEHLVPSSIQYQDTLHRAAGYFAAHGSSALQAQRQAIAWIGQEVQAQASLLSYIDVFGR